MRRGLIAAVGLALATSGAWAQDEPLLRPAEPAPRASAPFEAREAWCLRYAAWFIARMPIEGPLPDDVRPTQRMETEFNSCKLDPRLYERQTMDELTRARPARKTPAPD